MTDTRVITFSELSADPMWPSLIEGYAEECAMEGLPPVNCQYAIYQQLCDAGALHILGAYHDDELCGFVIMLINVAPHYGVKIAATESFFVALDKRVTGAGLELLRSAERYAEDKGAEGFLVSAPTGGRLEQVLLKSSSYTERNRVFIKELS